MADRTNAFRTLVGSTMLWARGASLPVTRSRLFSVVVLISLAGCHAGRRRDYGAQAHRPSDVLQTLDPAARLEEDVVAYAELCKQELGIDQPLPDLNCLAGVEVPITVNGQEVSERDFRALAEGRGGCDRAQWLDGKCWTYDLVQRVEIGDDVEAVLNCRQKLFTSVLSPEERILEYEKAVERNAPRDELLRLWRLVFEFDDLGLILRNRRSGKTCFFTFFGKLDFEHPERSYSYYGGWIPAPDQETVASRDEILRRLPEPKPPEDYPERMWYRGPRGAIGGRNNMFFTPKATAAGQCVSCHDHGAFKHSPFIDQAFVDGERVVPSNDRDVPYLPVGRPFQDSFREAKIVEIDTDPVAGEAQSCTACHRLTTGGEGAEKRRDWATGEEIPQPSYLARRLPFQAWMPLEHGIESRDDYHRDFGPMIEAIRCCEQTPNAIGCRFRPIGPTEADVMLDARGLLSEGSWVRGSDASVPACVASVAETH
jgi:hypothetical protein